MTRVRIAFASVTYAEKGRVTLGRAGVRARIVRLDPAYTKNGCTYALEIDGGGKTTDALRRILDEGRVRYGEIIEDRLPML